MVCKHKLKALEHQRLKKEKYKKEHLANIESHGALSAGWKNVAFEKEGKGNYFKSTSQLMRYNVKKFYNQKMDMQPGDVSRINKINDNL